MLSLIHKIWCILNFFIFSATSFHGWSFQYSEESNSCETEREHQLFILSLLIIVLLRGEYYIIQGLFFSSGSFQCQESAHNFFHRQISKTYSFFFNLDLGIYCAEPWPRWMSVRSITGSGDCLTWPRWDGNVRPQSGAGTGVRYQRKPDLSWNFISRI